VIANKVEVFAEKHGIKVEYKNSYVKSQPIEELVGMRLNSALIVSSAKTGHHDSFIKDEMGEIINILTYASLAQFDKTNYNPTQYYNNDTNQLIMNNSVLSHDRVKGYPVLDAQADMICCFGFGLKYIKTLLSNNAANLKKSFKFSMLNSENIYGYPAITSCIGDLTRHFIPCAEVLKYSNSNAYNDAVFKFVCCDKNETFTLKLEGKPDFETKSLYGHLAHTLREAIKLKAGVLAESIRVKKNELAVFQKTFEQDYKNIVLPYRNQQNGGKKVVKQEVCRVMYPNISKEQNDESSVEELNFK